MQQRMLSAIRHYFFVDKKWPIADGPFSGSRLCVRIGKKKFRRACRRPGKRRFSVYSPA
jgi:hypothetical protein